MGCDHKVLDSLEICKADLTVTVEDKNWVYGVANPKLTIAYEGLKNNEHQSLMMYSKKISYRR